MLAVDPAHSDEESTQSVMKRKPIETRLPEPMEEDIWWQMNQDFARDMEEELFLPSKKTVTTKQVVPKAPSAESTLDDEEWMAINADFARDDSHMEVEEQRPAAKTCAPVSEEPYGDYGGWWE